MTNGEKIKALFPDMYQVEQSLEAWDTWWNAEYKEPTTKNNLAVDCIVDILGSYTDLDIPYKREIAENILANLPSATPQEPILDKLRAEIKKLRPNLRTEQMTDYDYAMVDVVNDIVAIIDKYKGESEK